MRVAFVDHSFHQKTQSSRFFLELIRAHWTVEVILDHSWDHSANRPATPAFEPDDYDIIIIYQAHEFFDQIKQKHPNIVFVPMYDAMIWAGHFFWRECFNQAKVVSFSWALHEEVMRRHPFSSPFQYFPDPAQYQPIDSHQGALRAFFWYRTKAIGPQTVFDLCQGQLLDRLTLHNAPDPHQDGLASWSCPPHIGHLALSGWFESERDYQDLLRRHEVFFAPRSLEGIGMSFLEAMALGQCVVAPDAPTMNEYISNGTNGLLYPLERPRALDLSRAREMGARARDSIERGFRRWQASQEALLDFIAAPKESLTRSPVGSGVSRSRPSPAASLSPPPSPAPVENQRISVVTVCLNAAPVLESTLLSVLSQEGVAVEFVVLDGGSTDGSVEIIQRHAEQLAYWHSAPDGGIYPAMMLALEHITGDWVLFMNAGDRFVSADTLARMFAAVPVETDVVYGHHLYRQPDGSDRYRRAVDFEITWRRLQTGALGYDWIAGIPAHQATAVRRSLLQDLRFDLRYRWAADHDLLFRARRQQARFFNCDELIALYDGSGQSLGNFKGCHQEWAAIARRHGDPVGADRFAREMAIHDSVIVRTAQALFRSRFNSLQRRHPVLAAKLRGAVRRVLGAAMAGRRLLCRTP